MTSTGHTPGPWRYGSANNYWGFYIAPENRLPTLASVEDEGRVSVFNFPGQTEANARLISAAPELLEALERLDRDGFTMANWDFAKRVLAKAKGGAA